MVLGTMAYNFSIREEHKDLFEQILKDIRKAATMPVKGFVPADVLGDAGREVQTGRFPFRVFVEDEDFESMIKVSDEYLDTPVSFDVLPNSCRNDNERGVYFDI